MQNMIWFTPCFFVPVEIWKTIPSWLTAELKGKGSCDPFLSYMSLNFWLKSS